MIYLITGVPGSGKTLYAVGELCQKLLAEKVVGKDGKTRKRRLVVDGVPDLVLPHELMAARPDVEPVPLAKGETVQIEGDGLHNWWEWAQPGDVLLVDEVQRYWRPRGLGTKVPKDIAMLETHRHLGVDIVLITQNPMLVDQNVRRLVGRHLNVRRLFGGARALIYDWDGCQTDIHRTQGATRSVWRYPKKAYSLYKSSELHTKQRQKIPLWLVFPVVVAGLAVFAGPKAYNAMAGSLSGKGIVAAKGAASGPLPGASASASAPAVVASAARPGASAAVRDVLPSGGDAVVFSGCVSMRGQCRCYDDGGKVVEVEPGQCLTETGGDLPEKSGTMLSLLRDDRSFPVGSSPEDAAYIDAIRTGLGVRAARVHVPSNSGPKPEPLPVTSRLGEFMAAPTVTSPAPFRSARQ